MVFFAASVILVIMDQITKYMASVYLKPIGNMTIINGFLDFSYVENTGAAFNILNGYRWFFIIFTACFSVAIAALMVKMPKAKQYGYLRVCFSLLLAGAIGNLIDRVLNGYVIDFIEVTFISWPVFNFADIYVVVGTFILTYIILFVIKDEKELGG